MADIFIFHSLNDLIGNPQNRFMGKTDHYGTVVRIILPAVHGQGLFNNLAEIFVLNVGNPGPADQTGSKNTVFVIIFWLLDTVGGKQYRSREFWELFVLVLPCCAIMAVKMVIFFQFRISVTWQHLTMGVNVDSPSFGLLQQEVEIFQVMTGNYDGFTGFGT